MHSVKKPIKKRINNSSMGVKLSKRILLDTKVEPQNCRCVITYWMWMHVLIWKDVCSFIVYCWSCFDCTFSHLSLCHKL